MIRLLTQADEKIMLEYLERNEIETSFLYGNIKEFGVDNRHEIGRCGDYFGFFKEEQLKGILPFYNLGSCIPHFEDQEAVPLFAELMKERSFEFLIGMRKIIKPLYDEIEAYKETRSYDESYYFINRNFKPFILDGIGFTQANDAGNDKIIDFVMDARVNGFKQEVTREEVIKTLMQKGKEEEYIIAEKDGKMVAQACVQTYTPAIDQIGSVYTTELERGKGYCKATVSELCRRILERGKLPTLSVRKNNAPALRAYNALGFEYYDDYLLVRFN